MSCNQHCSAAQYIRLDIVQIIWPDARASILQAFSTRRRYIVRPAPDMHLFFTPFCAGIIFVQARKITIIAFVQRLIFDRFKIWLPQFIEDVLTSDLRTGENGSESDIKLETSSLKTFTGGFRFCVALLGQARIAPAGKKVFKVPFALSMADQHESTGHIQCSIVSVKSVVEPEYIEHRIKTGLFAMRP